MEFTGYQEFINDKHFSKLSFKENSVYVKTPEICLIKGIGREMGINVDNVEDRIQNAILTAIDDNITPKIELAIRSQIASCGRNATSSSVNSERGQHFEITGFLKTYSKGILHYIR